MAFRCAKCGAGLSVGQIDFEKRLGACQACGIVSLDLAPSNASVPQLSKGRTVPNGLSLTESVGPDLTTFVIRAPMSYTRFVTLFAIVWFMIGVGMCIASTMPPVHERGPGWQTDFDPPSRGLAVLFLLISFVPGNIAYRSWARRTTVSLSAQSLRARQTPGSAPSFELTVPIRSFTAVKGPVVAYVNEKAVHSWTIHCEAIDGLIRPVPISVKDEVQATYLAERLNACLETLQGSVPAGYRVPGVAPSRPIETRLAKPSDLSWSERIAGDSFEVVHEPKPMSFAVHFALLAISATTGSAPFWINGLLREGTQFGVAIALLFAPICMLVYVWRLGTTRSTLSCGPRGISVQSHPWPLRSMVDAGTIASFKVLYAEPHAFARIAAETTDGRTVKIPLVLVVAGHEAYVVERLNALLLQIRISKS